MFGLVIFETLTTYLVHLLSQQIGLPHRDLLRQRCQVHLNEAAMVNSPSAPAFSAT
jgi:hypothetical protein